jgi:hypothetical protein
MIDCLNHQTALLCLLVQVPDASCELSLSPSNFGARVHVCVFTERVAGARVPHLARRMHGYDETNAQEIQRCDYQRMFSHALTAWTCL